jgi:hypothetical protein
MGIKGVFCVKKTLLFFVVLLCLPSICFAEIKTSLDQFKNTFTVTSERVIAINPSTEMTCYLTKTYAKDIPKPFVNMKFMVSGNEYYFFSKNLDYIIEGEPVGNSTTWQIKDHALPSTKTNLLYAWGGRIIYDTDKIYKAIQSDKSVLFRVNFSNQLDYQFKLTPECIQEWKTVLNYDLIKEAEKLKNN